VELIPVDHDPFGAPPDVTMPQGGSPLKMTVRPQGARQLVPVDHDPFANEGPGYAKDMALAVPSGIAKGVAAVAGLPGDVSEWIGLGLDWLEQQARGEGDEDFAKRVSERKAKLKQIRGDMPSLEPPTSGQVRGAIERVTGPLYEPQTSPGRYAGAVSEFLPGAVGAGGGIRSLINLAVIPGVASETAGEATKGTKLEPWARAGSAVLAGGGASILNRPRTAEAGLRRSMSQEVSPQHMDAAEALMNDAAARGVRLTWAEALEQVAPGSGLTNLQRVVESSPGGREVMAPFMAERPQQIERAARNSFDALAPPNQAPSTIGPAARDAADSAIGDVRTRINQTAQPFYDAASTVRLTPAEMARVRALPGYQEARDAVRNDPQLNRYVAHLPEDSTGFLNEVKKQLDQQQQNAGSRFAQNRNQQRAAGFGRDASAVRNELTNSYFGNPARNYETALNIESQGRQQFLQPLLDGPLGKIAQRDTTTRKAIDALFPENPLPNSQREITTSVTALAARNQRAARDLVRAHAEATFNEAAQNLQSGANQYGGAKFAAVLVGNPQQRANLQAAVQALGPNGAQVWDGFNRFLEVAQATGTRQPKGSLTAFNAQDLKDYSAGGKIAGAAKLAGSPNKLLSAVHDAWSRWQLGNNLDQVAHILTDPASANLLRTIASRPTGSREAQMIAGRIALIANTARQSGSHDRK
jgi:hypothetical protein